MEKPLKLCKPCS